jgi:hypothetical protein
VALGESIAEKLRRAGAGPLLEAVQPAAGASA